MKFYVKFYKLHIFTEKKKKNKNHWTQRKIKILLIVLDLVLNAMVIVFVP